MRELAYAPFGETPASDLPSASLVQFTGRENDGTGLYYYRARYYAPAEPARGGHIKIWPPGHGLW